MKINWAFVIMGIIGLMCLYLLLGTFGLLPKVFYEGCNNITLEQAQTRGCCEDRNENTPTSWLFGSDNCDKYRITSDVLVSNEVNDVSTRLSD